MRAPARELTLALCQVQRLGEQRCEPWVHARHYYDAPWCRGLVVRWRVEGRGGGEEEPSVPKSAERIGCERTNGRKSVRTKCSLCASICARRVGAAAAVALASVAAAASEAGADGAAAAAEPVAAAAVSDAAVPDI